MLVPRSRTSPGGKRRAGQRAQRARLTATTVPATALAAAAVAAVAACGSGSAPAAGHTASPSSSASSGNLAGNGSGLCAAAAQVDSLTVQRTNALPGNHPRFTFPATETVRNAPEARSVAQSLCALPSGAHTQIACPADFGITYRLTFAAGAQRFPPSR